MGSEEKEEIELGARIDMWVNREKGEVGFLSRNLEGSPRDVSEAAVCALEDLYLRAEL